MTAVNGHAPVTSLLSPEHLVYFEASAIPAHWLERVHAQSNNRGVMLGLTDLNRPAEPFWQQWCDPIDRARQAQAGGEIKKYLAPPGSGGALWCEDLKPDAGTVLIVEGTKGHLAATAALENDPATEVWGINGCWGWSHGGQRFPLPAIGRVTGKHAVIYMDGDRRGNLDVHDAMTDLVQALADAGARSVGWIDRGTAKQGLDDLLALIKPGERASYLRRWIAGAKEWKPLSVTARKEAERAAERAEIEPERMAEAIGMDEYLLAKAWGQVWSRVGKFDVESDAWAAFIPGRGWERDGLTLVRRLWQRFMDHGAPMVLNDKMMPATEWLHSSRTMSAVLTHAASLDECRLDRLPGGRWDADPYLFGIPGGVLDLRTGQAREIQPEDFVTKQGRAMFDPAAACPEFDRFLSWALPDPEVQRYVQQLFGMALLGLVREHVLPVFIGAGRNGKGTLIRVMEQIFGSYSITVSSVLVLKGKGFDKPEYARADLPGARFAHFQETARGQVWNAAELKTLTGGDTVNSRAPGEKHRSTAPTHTLFLATNDAPEFDAGETAIWTRYRGIEFPNRLTENEIDPGLEDRLRAELPGILNWVLAGYRDYATHGLTTPASVLTASAAVRAESSGFHEFVRETMAVTGSPADSLTASEVWAKWGLYPDRSAEDTPRRSRDVIPALLGVVGDHPGVLRSDTLGPRNRSKGVVGVRWDQGGNTAFGPAQGGSGFASQGGGYPQDEAQAVDNSAFAHATASVAATLETGNATLATPSEPVRVAGTDLRKQAVVHPNHPKVSTEVANKTIDSQTTYRAYSEGCVEQGGRVARVATPCPGCGAPARVTLKGTVRTHTDARSRGAGKCPGSGAEVPGWANLSKAEKATLREQAEEAVSVHVTGEMIGLPAAMRRGEQPRAVTLAEVQAIIVECLRRNGGILAVDVENTARPIGHPDYRVQSVQLGDWAEGVDLDPHDPEQAQIIRAALAAAGELNAHNATADLAPLAHLGLGDYRAMFEKMVDTAVRMKLADPASVGNEAGLKDVSPAVLGEAAVSPAADAARKALFEASGWLTEVKPDTPAEKNGWAQVKPGCATMVRYAIADVLDCAAVRHRIPAPEAAVETRERRVQVITAPTAYVGVPLDAEQVSGQIEERLPGIAAVTERLAAAGIANADSGPQVLKAFTDRGVTLPDTTKFTMQKVTAMHPDEGVRTMAADVLAYRKDARFLSTFLGPWREQCERGDGVIRPTIYTLGADTGRMSSVRPNAQNLPKKGGARECWVAGPGKKIIRADMSSVEVRVIAALSQDPQLKAMLAAGLKLHDRIAEQVFGPGYTETQRGWAKNGVFAHFFGAGLEKLAATIQAPLEVAAAVVEALGVVAPGVAAWADQVKQAVRNGMNQFRTYSGRIIHLDTSQPHKAVNYLVQGTARELLVDTLLAWDDGPYAGGVIVPVHDEVIAWVDEDVADEATEYLVRCMTRELYGVSIICEPDPPSDRWDSYSS